MKFTKVFITVSLMASLLSACKKDVPSAAQSPTTIRTSVGTEEKPGAQPTVVTDLGERGIFRRDALGPIFSVVYSSGKSWILSFLISRHPWEDRFATRETVALAGFHSIEVALFDGQSRQLTQWKKVRDRDPKATTHFTYEEMITLDVSQQNDVNNLINALPEMKLGLRYSFRNSLNMEYGKKWIDLGEYCRTNPGQFHDAGNSSSGCPGSQQPEDAKQSGVLLTDFLSNNNLNALKISREDAFIACEKMGLHLPTLRELDRYGKEDPSVNSTPAHKAYIPVVNPDGSLDLILNNDSVDKVCGGRGGPKGVWSASDFRNVPEKSVFWSPGARASALCADGSWGISFKGDNENLAVRCAMPRAAQRF